MDCRTAEGLVNRYIEHELPVNELEEFLEHVQNCPSCYEELETYFIVHEVTAQLDDNSVSLFWILKIFWNSNSTQTLCPQEKNRWF